MEHLIHKLQGHRHHASMVSHEAEEDMEESEEDTEEELTRDDFNLNKIMILVTGSGKVRLNSDRHTVFYEDS